MNNVDHCVFKKKLGANAWWLGQLKNDSEIFNVFADFALVSDQVVARPYPTSYLTVCSLN